ncbi:hypothetical protein [Methanoculleus taiwanensis]|uniref:hypothetical protein n=1 Tax=Methanoculleus taiwanensis TaxID=1550565 RepID=UPI0013E8F047|nr:hypothetical protein [Methanoculleus taiwanensis]
MKSDGTFPERSSDRMRTPFDYDPRTSLDLEETLIERKDRITIHDVRYTVTPERKVTAYLVAPPEQALSQASCTSTPGQEAGIPFSTRR